MRAEVSETPMPVTDKLPADISPSRSAPPSAIQSPRDDGTHALLQAGFWITLIAILALIATETLFGGIGIDGPTTNAGWLAFMFASMGLPFGLLLLILGCAKWLRNRRLQRR